MGARNPHTASGAYEFRIHSAYIIYEFAKLKPSKLVVTIDNPLTDLFIRQTFFRQMLEKSRFAKHSGRQTFPLYGIKGA